MVRLEVDDGSPWWLSPDLWTVPGSDPLGPPGVPIAGSPCYIWARVHNRGDSSVTNAQVRYYWANPSVAFNRTTATTVGSAYVSLAGGQTTEVLCLTPWVPTFVNGGHECILAEAFHPTLDPLPAVPDFQVPTDRHVGQRNISVLQASPSGFFAFSFEAHNPGRRPALVFIAVEQLPAAKFGEHLKLLGLPFEVGDGELVGLGFTQRADVGEKVEPDFPERFELELGAGERRGLTLFGTLKGDAAAVHVTQASGERNLGGLTALVVAGEIDKRREAAS